MVNEDIRKKLPEDAMVFDNYAYDNSIIGTTFDGRAIYDFDMMVDELAADEGWTEEEAVDWVDYNTIRALQYVTSEKKPIVMQRV